ncbi:MAG: DUF4349 domain-containing protein [Gemmatimonadaceae bacterium]
MTRSFALALLTLAACSGEASMPAVESGASRDGLAVSAPAIEVADGARMAPSLGRGVAGGVAGGVAADAIKRAPQAGDSARMLIRTANVGIKVDSLETAMAALRRLATALGGAVGNVSVNAGEFQVRSATLELRVPSARFADAMAGMSPIGKVEYSNESAEDVGEEYVDLTARITNAKRLESRLIDLLATRTGKLEDVLAVERELARVREEIERQQGRVRYLSTRVATSTLSVTVSEPAPVVSEPGKSVIGEAFVRAWKNFVALVASGIASLGYLVPLGVVVLLAWRLKAKRRAAE